MNKMLKEFVEKVRTTKEGFKLINRPEVESADATVYQFIQRKEGNAQFVYYRTNTSFAPKFFAVVANDMVYIQDSTPFGYMMPFSSSECPEHCCHLTTATRDTNNKLCDTVFQKFVDELEEIPLNEGQLRQCQETVDEDYLYIEDIDADWRPCNLLDEKDMIDALCGYSNLEEIFLGKLNERRDDWVRGKSINNELKRLMA